MEYFASQAPRFNSFDFDLISDPKSYRDFGETGPWGPFLESPDN